MAISDGLLDIQAHLAQASATDELFGTRKTDEYVQLVARHQRPGAPIVRPAPGFFAPAQHVDPRKVARQHLTAWECLRSQNLGPNNSSFLKIIH